MEDQILQALSAIIDPDLNQDIVSLNFIKDLTIKNGHVSFAIELTTPACPVKDVFKQQAEDLVGAVEGVKSVVVSMTAQPRKNATTGQDKKNISQIGSILAVSSCKGGVGKSTVAINLAYSLKMKGAKVGILDADVYGPSLPTMVKTTDEIALEGNDIKPIDFDGIKCMSFGYALNQSDEGPAILRGPMVSQIMTQFLLQTKWGELDYLIIDMPPGTGDIQLTLCQLIPLTAAVIVTTPQHISFIDVVKGIEMFDTLKVPVVGVVENMSFMKVGSEKHYPFGQGAIKRLIQEFGFKYTLQFEIDSAISKAGDIGEPYIKTHGDTENGQQFQLFVDNVVREVSVVRFGEIDVPKIGYNKKDGIIIHFNKTDYFINPKRLRLECRSALSRDEFTGEPLIKPESISDDIYPLSMNPVGNYALGINWSDGHASLYPYDLLKDLVVNE